KVRSGESVAPKTHALLDPNGILGTDLSRPLLCVLRLSFLSLQIISRIKSMPDSAAKLAIIGIRYDENSSFTKGAADAPPQIRAALRSDAWNLTSENGTDLSDDSVFFDAGDIEPVPG